MTVEAGQGSRLASLRPAVTTDSLAFTASLDTEVTRLLVCNTSAGALTFRVFHVDAGGAPSLTNALFYDMAIAAKATFDFNSVTTNSGIQLKTGDMLYVRASSVDTIAFNVYGVTASIAPQM